MSLYSIEIERLVDRKQTGEFETPHPVRSTDPKTINSNI